jgi:HEPN domain-containing protein
MDMQLIRRIEKPVITKPETQEDLSELTLNADTVEIQEQIIQNNRVLDIDYEEPNYIPARDNRLIQSVGNSGWQVSEIWRDIRIDNFCDE